MTLVLFAAHLYLFLHGAFSIWLATKLWADGGVPKGQAIAFKVGLTATVAFVSVYFMVLLLEARLVEFLISPAIGAALETMLIVRAVRRGKVGRDEVRFRPALVTLLRTLFPLRWQYYALQAGGCAVGMCLYLLAKDLSPFVHVPFAIAPMAVIAGFVESFRRESGASRSSG